MAHRRFPTSSILLGLLTLVMGASIAEAQQVPASQPSTQPGRGARAGRGPVALSPRDALPFSNTRIDAINPALPTLFIAGDSTAANGDPTHRGWGAVLVDYIDTSKLNIVNYAQGGISFPGYYQSRWPALVAALKPGDFVIVELGHNGGHLPGTGDETKEGPARTGGSDSITLHTYGWYVRTFIKDAKAKGTTPIISSTSIRNIWTNPNATFNEARILTQTEKYDPKNDRVERGMGDVMSNGERTMLVWARQVAQEEKVPFVDHSNIAADVYEKMGRENVQKFHPADRTHFGTDGAIVQAETLIAGLKALPEAPLVNVLNDKGKAIAAYKPANK